MLQIQQHEIAAQIESALQTKARVGCAKPAAVYVTKHSRSRVSLGWNLRQGLEVGKTYAHDDGTPFTVLAVV